MQANRSRDTAPELAVRRLVHARGLRYRVAARPESALRRTADLVFTAARVAVFIDGCFWHGCPDHRTYPRTNDVYWATKIEGNIARDVDTTAQLQAAGWTVLRFWQHESPHDVADAVEEAVRTAPARRARLRGETRPRSQTRPRIRPARAGGPAPSMDVSRADTMGP